MKTKKATVLPAAGNIKQQTEPYQNGNSLSSLKLIIGGLLLFGNKDKKVFWPFFNAMLRQYIDLRLASNNGSGRSGATI